MLGIEGIFFLLIWSIYEKPTINMIFGLPWLLSNKESTCQCSRIGFHPWVGRVSWRRKWQPTPVFLPGKSCGQRSLAGYSPWGLKQSDTTERPSTQRLSHQVKSVRERQIPYDIAYIWNLKKKCYRWPYLQSRNRPTETENRFMATEGERWGYEG